jgi:hypothetical protein
VALRSSKCSRLPIILVDLEIYSFR